MKIVSMVGAEPNFIKMAPLIKEVQKRSEISPLLVRTGQHYDASMAGLFFHDLQLSSPDMSLEVGSGSDAYQTTGGMSRLESNPGTGASPPRPFSGGSQLKSRCGPDPSRASYPRCPRRGGTREVHPGYAGRDQPAGQRIVAILREDVKC